ncbi:peptidylprolyl isomerase [Pelagicoccus mobilis]|uniref:SurA N-terminal domain-containing protein n=1 Tax=Pelagicoccus mobilis TaxID=415221 RepID=A0A934RXG7_9BACT|nr:SurA N-terminal domain-containing protein [Pelagicoccus mobilis]MBK1876601.1 SurA N-terminal domain-containing protein [Pelagicoccus mobilis]
MISWLQNKLQKNLLIVFILFSIIIIAFVFTIGNQGPMSGRDERTADLQFYDTPMNTETARAELGRDAQLSAMLNGNQQADQSLPYQRATVRYIANLHSIPEPSKEQLREYIETIPAFRGPIGQFDAQAYNRMIDSLPFFGYTENDLRRVLADDYRINKVYNVLRGTGFVEESEILDGLSQRLAKWSVLVADYDLSTYSPELDLTQEMIEAHYEKYSFQYQTPERRIVDYIEIDAGQFVEDIKPSEDELITFFEENIDRYQPTPAEDSEEEVEPVTFEDVRLAVRTDLRIRNAREVAAERAHDLVVEIIEKEYSRGSEGLKTAFANHNVEARTSASFAANETPIGTTWGRDIVEQAFNLSEDRYFSEPFQHGNKAVVLFYNQIIEPTLPQLDTIAQRVAADLQAEEYRKVRSEYAIELKAKLKEASSSEESFGAAAEEAGMTVGSFLDFSLSEPAAGLNPRLLSAFVELEAGQVSDFARTSGIENQGAFVYVISKDIPEVSKDDPQYAQVEQQLKNLYGQFAANQYIQTLMMQEMQRIGLAPAAN